MSRPDPDVLEKIRKLLRMENGATDAERDTALAMASRIALKHGIDLAEVDVQEVTGAGEPFVDEEFHPTGNRDAFIRFPAAHKWVVRLIREYFAVEVLTSRRRKTFMWHGREREAFVDIMFIHGRRSAVQIGIYVYTFLYREFLRRWLAYLGQHPELSMRDRNGFYGGLYIGLREKLQKERGRVLAEEQEKLPSGTTMALVVQDEDAKREASLKAAHPLIRYVTTDYGHFNNYSAHQEGVRQGRQIKINPALEK